MRQNHAGARPALGALAALATGCLISFALPREAPAMLLSGAAIAACIAIIRPTMLGQASLYLAIALAGAAWADLRLHTRPDDALARVLTEQPSLVRVEGVVLEEPAMRWSQAGPFVRYSFSPAVSDLPLRVDALVERDGSRRQASGRAFVRVRGNLDHVHAGDRITFLAMATAPSPARNPGAPDWLRHSAQTNGAGFLSVASPALVQLAESERPIGAALAGAMARFRDSARTQSSRWLRAPDGSESRALLAAALLGERDSASSIHDAFARIGLGHLLSVSGLHLALLVLAALLALRFLVDLAGAEAIAIAALVLLYLLIVPVRTPVLRAAILVLVFLLADLAGRRYDRLALLAWAGVIILIWRPMEVVSVGAQLSFACVAALLVIEPPIRARLVRPLPDPDLATRGQRAGQHAARLVASSLACWLVATPIVAFHLGVVSPLGVLASIVFAPFFALVLAFGYLSILLSAIVPPLGGIAESILLPIAHGTAHAALIIDALPFSSVRLPAISPLWALAAITTVFWIASLPRMMSVRPAIAACVLVVWLIPSLQTPSLPGHVALRVDALDVGDGSCLLVRSGDEAILFDAGSTRLDAGVRELPAAFRTLGAPRVRRALLSHPNLDHFAAMPDLVRAVGLRELMVGPAVETAAADHPDGATALLLDEMAQRGVRVQTIAAGHPITLGDARVVILSPRRDTAWERDNDASLVIRFEVDTDAGPRALLLTGDIEDDAIASIIASHPGLTADIVEIPHHGSARRAAMGFVTALRPTVALQSTGPSRMDDERWDAVRAATPVWLVTARDGAIYAEILRDGSIRSGSMRAKARVSLPAPR